MITKEQAQYQHIVRLVENIAFTSIECDRKLQGIIIPYQDNRCKDCRWFKLEQDCQLVDKLSIGDDMNRIDPYASCKYFTEQNKLDDYWYQYYFF